MLFEGAFLVPWPCPLHARRMFERERKLRQTWTVCEGMTVAARTP